MTLRPIDATPPIWAMGSAIGLEVATRIFSRTAILRACYSFSRRYYVFVSEGKAADLWNVFLKPKENTPLEAIAGDFANELVDQQLRISILKETGAIRELIVAHALAEGNLLGCDDQGGYLEDPRGIGEDHR